jgi:hypothetical protein
MIRVGYYAGPDEARLLSQEKRWLAHALASQRTVGLVTDPASTWSAWLPTWSQFRVGSAPPHLLSGSVRTS